MPLRVGLVGAGGRMGRLLAAAVLDSEDLHLTLSTEHEDHPMLGRDVGLVAGAGACGRPIEPLAPGLDDAVDVFLDFSLPEGTARLLRLVGDRPLVIGTTGMGPDLMVALEAHARRAPVVVAPNFSTGVALLTELVQLAARVLQGYDAEIIEAHHRHKRDAPSGTALALAQALASARQVSLDEQACYGRSGAVGERPAAEIGIHAVRAGDIVGEHRVMLAGPGERIELNHVATSRQAFVSGALRALRWVHGRPPGLYGMRDVLGL
jgi:4-hydroxy-tetrahydrodipicolinate reductase